MSFFWMWTSSYPSTICWKAHSFSTEQSWCLCQRSVGCRCMIWFLDSHFHFICLNFVMPTTLSPWSVIVSLEIRKAEWSNFHFLTVLALAVPFSIPYDLRTGISIYAKKGIGIFSEIVLIYWLLWVNCDILTILSPPIHEYRMAFH